MKLNLKRSEIVNLNYVLTEIAKNNESLDKRFIYGVHRNLEYFKPEIESIKETQKQPKRFEEFQTKIQQIGLDCADRDEQGNPKTEKNGTVDLFVITTKREEANNKIIELQKEYLDVVEDQKKNLEVFNQMMNEEIEIEICKVSFASLPDKYDITKQSVLKYIIKETDEQIEAML